MSFRRLMNDTCNIYALIETQSAATGEEKMIETPIAKNVPCGFQNASDSIQRGQPLQTGSNNDRLFIFPQSFEFKKRETIIQVRGKKYSVDAVIDLGGRKKYLELTLTLISLTD